MKISLLSLESLEDKSSTTQGISTTQGQKWLFSRRCQHSASKLFRQMANIWRHFFVTKESPSDLV
jgi:hypothetical protein